MSDTYEQVHITSRAGWRAWLAANHETSPGVWAVTFKKQSGGPHVPAAAIAEEATAFGWVDSRPKLLDADRSQLLVTPRKARSGWSRVNKQRVETLESAGLMAPVGRRAVERAKADGSWAALDLVEELDEPVDLRAALDESPDSWRNWDGFPRSTKRAILEWIGTAKKAETRAARIAETAALAARNIRANQWRQPGR